jgi:hypothetical protein
MRIHSMNNIDGRHIFPANNPIGHSDVDIFYGTSTGEPALEMSLKERADGYEAVYTAAFLSAFCAPASDIVSTLSDGTRVVTNEALRDFLVREVRARLKNKPRLTQTPDTFLMSRAPAYIARPTSTCEIATPANSNRQVMCTQIGLERVCFRLPVPPGPEIVPRPVGPAEEISLPAALQSGIAEVSRGDSFPTLASATPGEATVRAAAIVETAIARQREDVILDFPGIAVYGRGIVEVAGLAVEARIEGEGALGPIRVTVNLDGPGAAVAVRFSDGSGTILPVLGQFGTHVTVGETGIRDLRFNLIGQRIEDDYIMSLRALAAEATRAGVLRFEGGVEERTAAAEKFAKTIRIGKGTDPTLGLFVAYAYSNALIPDGVRSVQDIMWSDLGTDLFDVALLAGSLDATCGIGEHRLVPPFPMLRQGWELLAFTGTELHPALAEARPHLSEALWTTFDAEGTTQLFNLVREGILPC